MMNVDNHVGLNLMLLFVPFEGATIEVDDLELRLRPHFCGERWLSDQALIRVCAFGTCCPTSLPPDDAACERMADGLTLPLCSASCTDCAKLSRPSYCH